MHNLTYRANRHDLKKNRLYCGKDRRFLPRGIPSKIQLFLSRCHWATETDTQEETENELLYMIFFNDIK